MGSSPPNASAKLTVFLCVCLMVVYMAQGLLITASKNESGGYDYDKNVSVMLSEICKFAISGVLLLYKMSQQSSSSQKDGSQPPLTSKIGVDTLKFAVPAVLYAVHNNIIFIALELISPVTYQLFNNIKIVTTGLVFRLFLSRPLKLNQWMAIILLPLSMCVTQLETNSEAESQSQKVFVGFCWMLVLSLCSAFAGVYNEFLIKKGQSSLMWKNMQLYFFSSVCCAITYLFSRDESSKGVGLLHGFGPMAWGVVLLNGLLGQIISAIFLYADNIVKVYAASGAVLTTPFVSHMFFNTPLHAPLFIGIFIALISLFMYFLPVEIISATDLELAERLNCRKAKSEGREDSDNNNNEGGSQHNNTEMKNLIQRNAPKSEV